MRKPVRLLPWPEFSKTLNMLMHPIANRQKKIEKKELTFSSNSPAR